MKCSKITRLMIAAGATLMTLSPLCAEKFPPPHDRGAAKMRGMRRNIMSWRVFSQLSDAERKRMHELQRSNPDQFAEEMRKMVDKYEQQERTQVKKLQLLIDQYSKSCDAAERAKLKAEVAKMEKAGFNQRLAGLERTIANAKRRVAMMEQELKKRKDKADEIVEARVEALLSGELPVVSFPPRRYGPPRPPQKHHQSHPHKTPGAKTP